ncbi:MAG: trimethylamine methyltransferase family protein [Candidatus Eisenbacteria bacterium]|uniref:Trimethylamine methyltransferase family protein n=1 Tax=Eiseniibacteriota bacterium TaxID=2212470 RepID=A0A948WF02_UNCEI|nr:trimethylamine methyltransferase family protein [Candidatus Eisenbacteria bacterium]
MRPVLKFLDDALIQAILSEARDILCHLGMEIHNKNALALLGDHGADIDMGHWRAKFPGKLIDDALAAAPNSFKLYNAYGDVAHDLVDNNVQFVPGSAAITVLDYETGRMRKPTTADYIQHVKLVEGLSNIASQSTAFIAADVTEQIQDSYRLYLSLLYGRKPVVTGAFTIESFNLMKDLQIAVRGSEEELKAKPLTVFSVCPTAPLKWSDVTSQNLLDCARSSIPVEYISMPLLGFMSPVTIVGGLVQHTAETLSGLVMSQLANPGAPVLYGGSPALFDVRFETTPMGAVETQMIDCAYNEIGKYLGLPTQAYISLSDAKQLDAQAGLETSMGATLAGLSGINSISGPGMLDFESCQSLEKLVLDNELAGMIFHLLRGIEPKEDFPALPHFQELVKEGHLLIAKHTRKHLRTEHHFPGPVIDRANSSRWLEEGALTLNERAHREVERILTAYQPTTLPQSVKAELTELMEREARRHGMDALPTQS